MQRRGFPSSRPSLFHVGRYLGVEVLHHEAVLLLMARLPILIGVGGVRVLVGVARRGRRQLRVEVARVTLHGCVVAHDHAEHDWWIALHDLPVSEATPDQLLHALQTLGIGEIRERPVGHAPSARIVEVLGHANIAPSTPLRSHGGQAHGPAVAHDPVKHGVGGGVVQLSHVAIDSSGREEPEELDGILILLESVVDIQCGPGLGIEGVFELFPGHVEEHAVLQDTRGVDDADEVWGVLQDPLIHFLLHTEIQDVLDNIDAEVTGHALDQIPIGCVLLVDCCRPRQELDGELLATLLLCLRQEPDAHDETQGTVAAGDADDASLGHLHRREVVVLRGIHRTQDIAPLVHDAHRVVAEGLLPEDLGGQILRVLGRQGPLGVDELEGAEGDLRPGRVGHAEKRGVSDEAKAHLLVDLWLVREAVYREDGHLLNLTLGIADGLQQVQVDLENGVLGLDDVRNRIAGRTIHSEGVDDHVPLVRFDQLLDSLLIIAVMGLVLNVQDANPPRRRLVNDLLAVAVAVCEEEDVLLLQHALVNWRPLAIDATRGVRHMHQALIDRGSSGVLDRQGLREPLDRPAHLAQHLL
mmetsp:Transcript_5119/g.10557  ORF Transcript_5119/g.10557 Transcript_5119/m.10557 type:complete len:583 (+) Transcript_5119:87-1835(+)